MFFETVPGFGTYLRRLWQRKPEQYDHDWAQYSVTVNAERIGIDPASHVLTVPMWADAGLPNFITNIRLSTLIENNHVWKTNSEGRCIYENYEHTFDTASMPTLYQCTFVVVCRLGDTTGDQMIVDFPGNYDNHFGDPGINLLRDDSVYGTSADDAFVFRMDNSANSFYVYSDTDVANTTTPVVIVARWDGSSGSIMVNGIKYTNIRDDTLDSISPDNWDRLCVNDDPTQNMPHSGEVNYITLLDTHISDDAAYTLSSYPYYLLQPVSIPLWFDMGAGGGGTVTQTADIDALIQRSVQQTTSMDAQVSKQQSVDLSVDAVLAAVKSVASDMDALLQGRNSKAVSADALLRATLGQDVSIDALLERIGVTASASIDALLERAGLTAATSLDAILYEPSGTQIYASLDALIRKAGITFSVDMDALVSKGYSAQLSLDALLSDEETVSSVLDAILVRSMAATLQMDALIAGTLSQMVYMDALLGDAFPSPAKSFVANSKTFNFSANSKTFTYKVQ